MRYEVRRAKHGSYMVIKEEKIYDYTSEYIYVDFAECDSQEKAITLRDALNAAKDPDENNRW